MPSIVPLRKMFSRPVSSGWKPVPTSRRLATRPRKSDAAAGRFCDSAQDLQKRALAGAVSAYDAENFALLHLEADILERPELLDLVSLHDLTAAQHVARLAREIVNAMCDDITQRQMALMSLGEPVPDEIALREVLDPDDGVSHGTFSIVNGVCVNSSHAWTAEIDV